MTANYSFLYLVTVCFLSFTCVWGMSHKTWCFFLRRALGTEQERTREWCLVSQGLLKGHGLSVASRWKLEVPWAVIVWEAAGEGHSVEVSPGGCWAGWGDTGAWLGGSLWYATIIWWQYPQAMPRSVREAPPCWVFSSWGAGKRLEQPRWATSWLTRHPAQVATWPGVGPRARHGSASPGRHSLIASAAGKLLAARGEEMKGRGGTSYLLLMLSSCISFQSCKTRTGLASSWWKRRQSSQGNMRGLEGVSRGSSEHLSATSKIWEAGSI